MSASIYRDRWRRPAGRAAVVLAASPAPLTLAEQWALAQSALAGAHATVQGLWEDAPAEYAAGNLDVVSAAGWSAAFATEAAVIEGALSTLMASVGVSA